MRVETSDPRILSPRDAIVKITLTAIFGSDFHLYNGYIPTMKKEIFWGMSSWGK